MSYYEIEWEQRHDEEFLDMVKDGDRVKYLNVRSEETGEIVSNVENTWNDALDRPQKLPEKSTSSYKFMIFDVSKPDIKPPVVMKKYEIWTGYYHLGQGYHGSTEPQKWGEEEAIDFKTACMKYELKSHLKRLEEGEQKRNLNMQDYEWFWNPHTNANSWIGKYYESKEDALKNWKA